MANKDGIVSIGFDYKKELDKVCATIEKELNNLGGDINLSDGIKKQMAEIKKMITDMNKDIGSSFDKITETKLDTKTFKSFKKDVNKRIREINKEVTTLKELFSTLDGSANVNSIVQQFANLKKYVEDSNSSISEFINNSKKLGKSVIISPNLNTDTLKNDVIEIRKLLTVLNKEDLDFGYTNKSTKELTNDLEGIVDKYYHITDLIDEMKTSMNGMDATTQEYKNQQVQLSKLSLELLKCAAQMDALFGTKNAEKININKIISVDEIDDIFEHVKDISSKIKLEAKNIVESIELSNTAVKNVNNNTTSDLSNVSDVNKITQATNQQAKAIENVTSSYKNQAYELASILKMLAKLDKYGDAPYAENLSKVVKSSASTFKEGNSIQFAALKNGFTEEMLKYLRGFSVNLSGAFNYSETHGLDNATISNVEVLINYFRELLKEKLEFNNIKLNTSDIEELIKALGILKKEHFDDGTKSGRNIYGDGSLDKYSDLPAIIQYLKQQEKQAIATAQAEQKLADVEKDIGSSSVSETQNKIQEELKETQKQAEQTSESLSKVNSNNVSFTQENSELDTKISNIEKLNNSVKELISNSGDYYVGEIVGWDDTEKLLSIVQELDNYDVLKSLGLSDGIIQEEEGKIKEFVQTIKYQYDEFVNAWNKQDDDDIFSWSDSIRSNLNELNSYIDSLISSYKQLSDISSVSVDKSNISSENSIVENQNQLKENKKLTDENISSLYEFIKLCQEQARVLGETNEELKERAAYFKDENISGKVSVGTHYAGNHDASILDGANSDIHSHFSKYASFSESDLFNLKEQLKNFMVMGTDELTHLDLSGINKEILQSIALRYDTAVKELNQQFLNNLSIKDNLKFTDVEDIPERIFEKAFEYAEQSSNISYDYAKYDNFFESETKRIQEKLLKGASLNDVVNVASEDISKFKVDGVSDDIKQFREKFVDGIRGYLSNILLENDVFNPDKLINLKEYNDGRNNALRSVLDDLRVGADRLKTIDISNLEEGYTSVLNVLGLVNNKQEEVIQTAKQVETNPPIEDVSSNISSVNPKLDESISSTSKIEDNMSNVKILTDNFGKALDPVLSKFLELNTLTDKNGNIYRLFHNSPEIFDKFDTSKSGSNQGMALGAGNYLALSQSGEYNSEAYGKYQTQWYALVKKAFDINADDTITQTEADTIAKKFFGGIEEGFGAYISRELAGKGASKQVEILKDAAEKAKTTIGDIFNSIGYDAIKDGAEINVFNSDNIVRASEAVLDISQQPFQNIIELSTKLHTCNQEIQELQKRANTLESYDFNGKSKEEAQEMISDLDNKIQLDKLMGTGWISGYEDKENLTKMAAAYEQMYSEALKLESISDKDVQKLVEKQRSSSDELNNVRETLKVRQEEYEVLKQQQAEQKKIASEITNAYLNGDTSNPPIKDVFQGETGKSGMDAIASSTEEAVQAKKDFATANEGVQSSIDDSKSPLQLEAELMDQIAKSAREAADAKKEFVEANKQVKDSADASNGSTKKNKYKDKSKVSEDEYSDSRFASIANKKLSDNGFTILGESVNTELVDGLVKVNAKIKTTEGTWKTFSAKIDADGNMFEQRFRTITKGVDKLEAALKNFGREISPALTYQETLDKAKEIRDKLQLGGEYSIKVDSNELVTITKKLSDVNSTATSVTQTFKSAEDAIQNFGQSASNSAEKTSVALKGVKANTKVSSNASDVESAKQEAKAIQKLAEEKRKLRQQEKQSTQSSVDQALKDQVSAWKQIQSIREKIAKSNDANEIENLKKVKKEYQQSYIEADKILKTNSDLYDKEAQIARLEQVRLDTNAKLVGYKTKQAEQEKNILNKAQNKVNNANIDIKKLSKRDVQSGDYVKAIENYKNAVTELQNYINILNNNGIQSQDDIDELNRLQKAVDEVSKSIKNMTASEKGTNIAKSSTVFLKIEELRDKYKGMSKDMLNELDKLERKFREAGNSLDTGQAIGELKQFETQLIKAGTATNSLWSAMKNKAFYNFANQLGTMVSFYDVINVVRQAGEAVIDLNTNITELAKVSEASASQIYDDFNSYADIAKEVGGTISDTISATADWSRNGYNIPDAKELAEVAMIYKNVGDGIDIDTANEYLISTLRGFSLEAKDAMDIIDSINEVANNEPISSAGIGDALQRSAAAFNAANTSLQESIALVTSTNSVLQSPEKVGSMWTTVSARIRGAKTELEDAGLETDGMVESTSKLQAMIKGMTGFDILESDGKTFKSIYDIIVGIGDEFQNLSGVDQAKYNCLYVQKCA